MYLSSGSYAPVTTYVIAQEITQVRFAGSTIFIRLHISTALNYCTKRRERWLISYYSHLS
ncbi:MAG: hypothetical protein NVS4B8_00440 [Herpetosiphon sp.]